MKKLVTTITALALAVTTASTAFAEVTPLRYDNTGYVYYCVGNGWKGEDYIDTTKEAQTVQTYINSWGYFCDKYGCIKNPKAKDITEGRLNSPIVYLAGHGTSYSVDCGDSGVTSSDRATPFVNISNFNFDSIDLAFLAACKTNSTSNSITKKFVSNGAKYAIGWVGKPETAHMLMFTRAFFSALNDDKSFGEAEKYAELKVSESTEDQKNADIYTYSSEGDKNAKPDIYYARSKNNSSILDLLIDKDSYTAQYVIDENVSYKAGSKNYDEMVKYIKNNINPNFNIDNYEIREEDFDIGEKITNILFTYTFKGIRSNFKYSVNVNEDGNVILISQIGEDLSTYEPTGEEKINEDTDEILKMARERIEHKDSIKRQKISKYFASRTKEVVYEVETIVNTDNITFEYIP